MNGDGKLYIRAIRNIASESMPEWVVIDTFENIKKRHTHSYQMGTRVYDSNGGIISEINQLENYDLRGSLSSNKWILPIVEKDEISLPNIRMYITLGMKLKHEGFVFNKKTHEIRKKGGD